MSMPSNTQEKQYQMVRQDHNIQTDPTSNQIPVHDIIPIRTVT